MKKRFFYGFSALLLIALVGTLGFRFVSSLFARTLTCNTWRTVATPRPGENQLTSIALLSAQDIWLAGRSSTHTSHGDRPLVEHWDGQRWQMLFPPDPSTYGAAIASIAASSDNDVWVVGNAYTSPGTVIPLAARWDGQAWHLLPTNSTPGFTRLFGVTALASNDVWAVGETYAQFTQTFIEHWDGSNWKRVPSPNIANENNSLTGIAALSANDIWAVGNSKGYQGSQLTLTEHWDGSRWSIVSSPNPSRYTNALISVAAASSNDVWAVGTLIPSPTLSISQGGRLGLKASYSVGEANGLIEHWDGQHWQVVSFPKLGEYQGFSSITAYSSKDVWAAGIFITNGSQGQTFHGLLEHWDGSAWHVTEDQHDQYIVGIVASPSGNLWSIGSTVPPRNASVPSQSVVEACF